MVLPDFPEFTDIDVSFIDIFNDALLRSPLEASEYTFTNLFAFRKAYDFRVSRLGDSILILRTRPPLSMFCPVGTLNLSNILGDIFSYLRQHTEEPFLERVPESIVNRSLRNNALCIIDEERDHFDYVHDVRELIELQGSKYHEKKNRANKFRSTYGYEYLQITPDLVDECLAFEDYWCEVKDCGKYPGLEKERCAILEMLRNFSLLRISGGAIRIDGKIAALSLGEKISRTTFVIHVEKANPEFQGLYQVINQEFLIHEAIDCKYVNREQDLGIKGLRKAKMSYHPVKFIQKYTVREKQPMKENK
jgi:hypothetical protein